MRSGRFIPRPLVTRFAGSQGQRAVLLALAAACAPVLAVVAGTSLTAVAGFSLSILICVLLLTASKRYLAQAMIVAIVWIPPFAALSDTALEAFKALALLGLALIFQLEGRSATPSAPMASPRSGASSRVVVVMLVALGIWVAAIGIGTATLTQGLLTLCGVLATGMALVARKSESASVAVIGPAYIASAVLTMAGDLAMFVTGRGFDTGANAGRFSGSLGDYELLGQFYAIACVITLGLLILASRWWSRCLHLGVILVAVFLLLQTQSRSALLLALFGMSIILSLAASSWKGRRSRASRTGALAVVGLPIIVWPFVSELPIFERFDLIRFGEPLPVLFNRAFVWQYFPDLQSFQQASWHGNGLSYPYDSIGTYPHSLYLYLIWTVGWIGLIVFVAALASLLVYAVRSRNRSIASPWTHIVAVALSLSLLEQVKIEMTREPSSQALFWFIALALAASVGEISKRSEVGT